VLSSAKITIDAPLLGTINVTSATAFDIGVYLVVVGVVLMAFEAFGGEPDEQPS
jgi:multisubunit Na+/H+ antiporter MnhB subunit